MLDKNAIHDTALKGWARYPFDFEAVKTEADSTEAKEFNSEALSAKAVCAFNYMINITGQR